MVTIAAKKLGMSRIYIDSVAVPVTLVKVYDSCVSDVMLHKEKDFSTIVVSFDETKKVNKVPKPVRGLYEKRGLSLYRKRFSFQTSKLSDKEYAVGNALNIKSLDGVYKVDASGVSIGKGFAGAMKRHNFAGLRASHGVSLAHRSAGSTGQCQDPGRVFKGKKMAGHMGSSNVTVKNLRIVSVDDENGILCIKGGLPGAKNGVIFLKPSNS